MRFFCKQATMVVILVWLGGCSLGNENQRPTRSLEEIIDSGTLVVLTRNAPSTWYIGRDGKPTGPEYDMVEAFAASLDLDTEYREKPSIQALLQAVERGEGDVAAAGVTVTPRRNERFRFGPRYQQVTQQVVCRRDNVQPDSVADLAGLDVRVIADSSYSERLAELQQQRNTQLAWQEVQDTGTEELLQQVWEGAFDCTVADSNIVDINRRYFPELIASLNISTEQQLGWVFSVDRRDLQRASQVWFEKFEDSGRLAHVQERYYGFYAVFDYVDIRKYIRRIDRRFPQYHDWFREAAKKHDLPFTLIAAQGYQESHWDAEARSPTGVRGIMMLTRRTARSLGVKNRLDPRQSIFGGARYLAKLEKGLEPEIREPDRTWLALAAYNVGRGHLHDAQALARDMDLSPYRWRDIKQVLPLLAEKRYYKNLKYGYARGSEPVRYVQRIREYRHVLEEHLE